MAITGVNAQTNQAEWIIDSAITGGRITRAPMDEFKRIISQPGVTPEEVVAAAANLKIELSIAQAIYDSVKGIGKFSSDVVSQAVIQG